MKIRLPLMVFIPLIIVSALVNKVYAAERVICNTCESKMQFETRALSEMYGKSGPIIIVNMKLKEIRQFFVMTRLDFKPVQVSLLEMSISSEDQKDFDELVKAANEFVAVMNAPFDVPPDIAESAYELAGATFLKNDVLDSWSTYADHSQRIDALVSSVSGFLNKIVDLESVLLVRDIDFRFVDGSMALVRISGIDTHTLAIELELISAVDVDNNDISFEASHYRAGTFRFTRGGEDSIAHFLSAAQRLNVNVGLRAIGSGTVYIVDPNIDGCFSRGETVICPLNRED